MRTLFLLRGAPGSGKSTWIKQNNLEAYTISADQMRQLCIGPEFHCDGTVSISQNRDGYVWDLMMSIIEARMKHGELLIIDATHYRKALLNKYKNLAKQYRYRQFIIDFTDISEEECLKRNAEREEIKRVPEGTIQKMCAVFRNEKELREINNTFVTVTRDKALDMIYNSYDPIYLRSDKYKRCVVIPDIHGCYETLKRALETINGIDSHELFRDDYYYIFLGDYFDRGPDSIRVYQLLNQVKDQDNIVLLEGNHEAWFRYYVQNNIEEIRSKSFFQGTMPQFEYYAQIMGYQSHKPYKSFLHKLAQSAYIQIGTKRIFLTHGGVPLLEPDLRVSTEYYIKGTGGYEDIYKTYAGWITKRDKYIDLLTKSLPTSEARNMFHDYYMVHGHRNNHDVGPEIIGSDGHIFNLCSHVEYGEKFRIMGIDIPSGDIHTYDISNMEDKDKLPKKSELRTVVVPDLNEDLTKHEDLFGEMRIDPDIKVISFPNGIESFCFKRNVFESGNWTAKACLARGLFVADNSIIARGYNKFFYLDENKFFTKEKLNLQYPLVGYKKYNGFLGIMSYNPIDDTLFTASKTRMDGPYADMFRKQLDLNEVKEHSLKQDLRKYGITLLFEVIDKHDPHIMDIIEEGVVLLDAVENTVEGKVWPYEKLCKFAEWYHFKVKDPVYEVQAEEYLDDVLKEVSAIQPIEGSRTEDLEGIVFVDQKGTRFKHKTDFYNKWKRIRKIRDMVVSNRVITYVTPEDPDIVAFLKSLDEHLLQYDSIPGLRRKYTKWREMRKN